MFSIGNLAPSIVQPLRYFFSKYTGSSNLFWDEDEKKRTLDIAEAFDFNRTALGEKPRIMITRGGFSVNKTGISDNLAEGKAPNLTGGKRDNTNFIMFQGTAIMIIEARTKGTCELLADMATSFLIMTRPILCDDLGWKEFAMPMMVGDCNLMSDEDAGVSKFQVQVQIPWVVEEAWRVRNDGPELKKIIQSAYVV